ncbi:MAG: hypothetical protein A2Y23_07135 [Clostridiales bacterium GWB2_37_7]|nr:MAG: hypothetical protein A2Y23_07135 [Clostridiales bacterium GWB2_37_7]
MDRIRVTIDGVRGYWPFNNLLSLDFDGWKFYKNSKNEFQSKYVNDSIEGIHIEYRPYTAKGRLSLDLNISVVLMGDNIGSVYCYNVQDLVEKINDKLNGVISLYELPHLRFWRVSSAEINFNIIGSKSYVDGLYIAISKMKPPQNYRLNDRYKERGTIYMNKDKKKGLSSIKIYYKLKERVEKGIKSESAYYDCKDLINIRPGEDVLRFEVKMCREDLITAYRRYTRSKFYKDKRLAVITQYKYEASFEDIFDYDFQLFTLDEHVKELHLDKVITTRANLFQAIDNSKSLTPKYKKNMKEGLRFLNGEIRRIKLSSRTLANYIAVLDECGYHYIYSDAELPGVSLEGIIAGLPTIQRQINEFYKDGNIMTDVWYRKATPEVLDLMLSRRSYNKEVLMPQDTEGVT